MVSTFHPLPALSISLPLLFVASILLQQLPTVSAVDCTTVNSWSDLRTAILSLKKSQKTLVLCPFDITHSGATASDGIDLYKKGVTLACQAGGGGDEVGSTGNVGGGAAPQGCIIRGSARYFNVLADSVALVGLTFQGSQHSAINVGEYVWGTTISNCVFNNNIRVAGDGGAIALGAFSESTLVVGCEFNRNAAWGGGALSGVGSIVKVRDCLFRGNRASIGVVSNRLKRSCHEFCVLVESGLIFEYRPTLI